MKIEIRNNMIKTFTLLLTAVFMATGITDAEEAKEQSSGNEVQPGEVGPDTIVYCDALWMRVHAADCPELILKEKKKTGFRHHILRQTVLRSSS